jgi:hypothetical protein
LQSEARGVCESPSDEKGESQKVNAIAVAGAEGACDCDGVCVTVEN